ncbi:DUF2007 domain-containing protein [Winogradskyella sp.]|uniref:DUF2007 domain-containing protein n=1 Tax=Winogradskyella sp. TaxID=1883156 RepID=UPI0026192699|nr:DUF2007 domain-containing protein [Winogradskyella sp.]
MQDTFVTIARYQYSSEAQIVKGRLEADGIEVFLRDNITIDTDPLVSNAIKCPNCQQERVNLYSTISDFKSFFSFIIGFITGTLPFSARYQYRCEACDTVINTKD